jgi:uncharacterized protein YraI
VMALVVSLLPPASSSAEAASTVYVANSWANVRTGPSTGYPVVLTLARGEAVAVTGTVSGQWVGNTSTWYQTRSGYYISAAVVGQGGASVSSGRSGRWIDVNLSTLQARAMVGDRVAYSAPIVTGRPGWETPVGTYYVQRRAPSVTMNSATIGIPHGTPGSYLIPNVRWTQYFTPYGHAIHGNHWVPDTSFGQSRTSRGCIGMRNSDAAVFYDFATLGTPIVIHY